MHEQLSKLIKWFIMIVIIIVKIIVIIKSALWRNNWKPI